MKRGRRSKEPMTKEQIEKKKKKIIKRFIIIVAIIILAIIAYIANDFIILDKNEKTNLVINNNNITSNLKNDILIENDIIYLSKQDIANFFEISSTILFPIRIHILQSDELRPEMFYILVIFS